MKVRILFLFFLIFPHVSENVFALSENQYPGFKPVRDLAAFNTAFKETSLKVQTISSDFTQEKNMLAITEKIISTGKFWFKRTDKVRLDYTAPFTYRMIINGDKIYIRDDQQENRINVKANRLFKQINHIIVDCIQGSILENKDFTIRVFENDKQYLMEMTPVSKQLAEFFSTIVLIVDRQDYSVASVRLNEAMGDHTIISFTNKNINVELSDEVFAF